MRAELYQVDAFTNQLFRGNYAAVVPTTEPLAAALMQQIASENNLSETAFVWPLTPNHYQIRWFSPLTEIDFCGHATLAAAFVLFSQGAGPVIRFSTQAVGDLSVRQNETGRIEMDFPLRPAKIANAPATLLAGVSAAPLEVWQSPQAWMLVYANEQQVRELTTDSAQLKQLAPYDVVVTAPGLQHDFVSRYFWPANGGDEDPVTGSIHAALAPYWAERLGKTELTAFQASARGGELWCRLQGDRVLVSGEAVLYLKGEIQLPV